MSNIIIKLSSEALAAVGAKTDADFSAAFAKTISDLNASAKTIAELQSANKTLSDSLAASALQITALEKSVKDLTASVGNVLTEARVREIAEAAGSKAAVGAVGAVGAGAPPAAPSNSAQPPAAAADNLIAAGKYAEAWAADKNLQAEFPTAESFAAFKKNEHKIRIKKN